MDLPTLTDCFELLLVRGDRRAVIRTVMATFDDLIVSTSARTVRTELQHAGIELRRCSGYPLAGL